MRIVALLTVRNEERFIAGCLEHLLSHGIEVHLIDNGSTDHTAEIVSRYLGQGVLPVESMPFDGTFAWRAILERKQELAAEINADWFLNVDADEIHLPPPGTRTLAEAIGAADHAGANAVHFQEFVFVPTQERPDHDHPRYSETMLRYYAFQPRFPHRLNAWRKGPDPPVLTVSGGHAASFSGRRIHEVEFPMLHYLFLSPDHAIRKWVHRNFDPDEVADGWHRGRVLLRASTIRLQREDELRSRLNGLDHSQPLVRHPVFAPAP